MILSYILNLALIVFITFTTVYDDFKKGLIRNKRIVQGMVAGTIFYTSFIILQIIAAKGIFGFSYFSHSELSIQTFGKILLNTLCGFVCGVFLWNFKVWAAGDAKLFTLYCYLIPTYRYISNVPLFPGLVLLINVFTITFFFLIVDAIAGGTRKLKSFFNSPTSFRREDIFKNFPKIFKEWFILVLIFASLFAGMRAIREAVRETLTPVLHLSDFLLFMVLFITFKPLSKMVKKTWGALIFGFLSAVALVYLAYRHGIISIPDLVQPGGMAIVLIIFTKLYQKIAITEKTIKVGELKPGMILSGKTLAQILEMETGKENEINLENKDEEEGLEAVPSKFGKVLVDGLSREQVRFIKTRFQDDELISVARTIPFSPFLAFGAIWTFFTGRVLWKFITSVL